MSLKAVVGKDASKVGMSGEEHAKHIPSLSLIPICTPEDRHTAGDCVGLGSVSLDPNSSCMLDTQQIVHDLEALFSLRKIDGCDVDDALELALRMIPQERQDGNDRRGCDMENKFVLQDGKLLNELGKALSEIGAVGMQGLGGLGIFRCGGIGRSGFSEGGSGSLGHRRGLHAASTDSANRR